MAATEIVYFETPELNQTSPERFGPPINGSIYEEFRLQAQQLALYDGQAWRIQALQTNKLASLANPIVSPFLFRRRKDPTWRPLPPDTWVRAEWVARVKFSDGATESVAPWEMLYTLQESDLPLVLPFIPD